MDKKDFYFQAKRNIKVLIYDIKYLILAYLILIIFFVIYKKVIISIIVVVSIIAVPAFIGGIIGILIRFDRFYYDEDGKITFSNRMGKIRKEDLISLYRIEECFRHFYKFRFLKDIDIHLLVLSFGDKPDLINNIKLLANKKRELLNDPDSYIIYKETFEKEKRL